MNLKSHNIYADIYAKTPVEAHITRSGIYRKSKFLEDKSSGEIIEISGYLSLEDKFFLWNQHGKPKEFLYFSIDRLEICPLSGVGHEEHSINWCIGWISEDGIAFVFIDMLNLLVDYHYQCHAREIKHAAQPA